MIGDTIIDDGEEYTVVWSGGEGLLPDRETRPSVFWTPPKRMYNKKSDYWTRIDKQDIPEDNNEPIERRAEAVEL